MMARYIPEKILQEFKRLSPSIDKESEEIEFIFKEDNIWMSIALYYDNDETQNLLDYKSLIQDILLNIDILDKLCFDNIATDKSDFELAIIYIVDKHTITFEYWQVSVNNQYSVDFINYDNKWQKNT